MCTETDRELLTVIRQKCLDCCGGSRRVVEGCTTKACPLYAYRLGQMPEREKGRPEPLAGQMNMFDGGGENGR